MFILKPSRLLSVEILLKLAFRFCPPFVHENIFCPLGDIFSKSSLVSSLYALTIKHTLCNKKKNLLYLQRST